MQPLKSHESVVLSLGVKAQGQGEITVPCAGLALAQGLRARAYAASAAIRKRVGKEPGLQPLVDATMDVSIHINTEVDVDGEKKFIVLFRRKDRDPAMLAALEVLEVTWEEEEATQRHTHTSHPHSRQMRLSCIDR